MIDRILRPSLAVLLAFPAVLLTLAAGAPRALAELVVFENGRVLKIVSHRETGDRIEIRLQGGGSMTFDRTLVVGIEKDEVAAADVQAPPVQAPLVQSPAQPPARLEASRPAVNEQVTTPDEAQDSLDEPKAPEENRPVPTLRRHRRHRR